MATDEGMNPGDEYTGSIYDTDDDTENCPRCGKPLEIRGGRHGDFIGCTGYPKCKYTRSYEVVE
jgi:ssDNA-binding Zn-finger/Zn-ribbon topoisomerase 1